MMQVKIVSLMMVATIASARSAPQWTRQMQMDGAHTVDVSNLANSLAKEWATAFPSKATLDGTEQNTSDLILEIIRGWSEKFPFIANDVTVSSDDIKRGNNLAVNIIKEWANTFPSDRPTPETSISRDAIKAISDTAMQMAGKWSQEFPAQPIDMKNVPEWATKGAKDVSDDQVLAMNSAILNMVKLMRDSLPAVDLPEMSFKPPKPLAVSSITTDQLNNINDATLNIVKQMSQAVKVDALPVLTENLQIRDSANMASALSPAPTTGDVNTAAMPSQVVVPVSVPEVDLSSVNVEDIGKVSSVIMNMMKTIGDLTKNMDLSNIKVPEINSELVNIPNVDLSNIKVPEIKIPNIDQINQQFPIPDFMKDFKIPQAAVDLGKVPTAEEIAQLVKIPDFKIPQGIDFKQFSQFPIPEYLKDLNLGQQPMNNPGTMTEAKPTGSSYY